MAKEFLKRARDFSCSPAVCKTLGEALAALASQTFDVALVDLYLPDSSGVETVQSILAAQPSLPVVAPTNFTDQDNAVKPLSHGVQDYLVKPELDSEKLSRALRFAMERRLFLRREPKTLDGFPFGTPAAKTGRLFGQGPLKEVHPKSFEYLAGVYVGVLRRALAEMPFGEESVTKNDATGLAECPGRLKAGPKDLVDVYTEAFKRLSEGASVEKIETLAREGRLSLERAMGYMVIFYRGYCQIALEPVSLKRDEANPAKNESGG